MARRNMTIREAEQMLQFDEPYSLDDLSKRYRARAKKAHPDLGGTEAEMQQVNEAYECLRGLFDGMEAGTLREPLSGDGHGRSRQGEAGSGTRYGSPVYGAGGVESSVWASAAEAAGIPFDDFMDFMTEYEKMRREEEEQKRAAAAKAAEDAASRAREEERQGADGAGAGGRAGGDGEHGEAEGIAAGEDEGASGFTRFRHKLARFFAMLCHLPYGIAALAFFEWQVLSADRTMSSIFDGIGMLFDIVFEVLVVAPLLAWIVRKVIRAVLGAIARVLAR